MSLPAAEPFLQTHACPVDIIRGRGEPVLKVVLEPCEQGDFIGQKIDADQNGQDALTRCDKHDESRKDADPAKCMLKQPFGMPVPDQTFHEGPLLNNGGQFVSVIRVFFNNHHDG